MSDYEARILTDAIYMLKSIVNSGDLNELFRIHELKEIVNSGSLQQLSNAIQALRDFEMSGSTVTLKEFNETSADLVRSLKGYEADRLCDALEKIKALLTEENQANLKRLAANLDDSALNVLLSFNSTARETCTTLENDLPELKNSSSRLSNEISTLTGLVNDLGREVYQLREDRKARQRDNINLEIRNYLDLLKDPMMMQALGLTREMIATKLAELLNKNGLKASYITEVAKEDTKQNTLK